MVDKIKITQSTLLVLEMLAAGFAKEDQEKAEAAGLPFDYEESLKKYKDEVIEAYVRQEKENKERQDRKDRAFLSAIRNITNSTKLCNLFEDHVSNLEIFLNISDDEVAKIWGVGQKTLDEFKKARALVSNPKVRTKLNKAIAANRKFFDYQEENRDVLRVYHDLRWNTRSTERDLEWIVKRYDV